MIIGFPEHRALVYLLRQIRHHVEQIRQFEIMPCVKLSDRTAVRIFKITRKMTIQQRQLVRRNNVHVFNTTRLKPI